MHNFKLTKLLDKLFVLLVLLLLVVPLAKFNLDARSVEENRMLAKWPLWADFHVLAGDNYFKALEGWFNDRFKLCKKKGLTKKWCRGPDLNRYGDLSPRDFKSLASASSATSAYNWRRHSESNRG